MTSVATKRLIDASAKLGPDDRALLSLLIHHGLDDVALARLTRAGREELTARRELLAERLGTLLELPSATVQDALDELAGTARGHHAAQPPARGANHTYPDNHAEAASAASAAALPAHRPRDARPVRNRRRASFTLLGITAVVIAVLVIALAGGGGSGGKGKAAAKAGRTHVPPRSAVALAGLPGGPAGVSGTVAITGPAAHPKLAVAVSRLPAAGSGHYELWLYNSIIDSAPLAALSAPRQSVVVALPPDYRRYRWLDVSLQPAGSINDSGESVLRGAVPAG